MERNLYHMPQEKRPKPPRQSTYISIQLSLSEKEVLDERVRQSGMNRNRFLRNMIAVHCGEPSAAARDD